MLRRPPRSTLFPYTTSSDLVGARARERATPHLGSDHSGVWRRGRPDRKSTRLNSSHGSISYAVFCLKKKTTAARSSHTKSTTSTSYPAALSLYNVASCSLSP